MKTFLHLLKRELLDYRWFFPAALACGLLPYALAPFATHQANEIGDVRATIARVVVLGFFLGAPLAFGTKWLVAGLLNGRRSFELARPLSAWQLCGSRLGAIGILVVSGSFLAALPTGWVALQLDDPRIQTVLTSYRMNFSDLGWQLYQGLAQAQSHPFFVQATGTWAFQILVVAILFALGLLLLSQSLTFAAAHPSWWSLLDLSSWLILLLTGGYSYYRLGLYDARGILLSWLIPAFSLLGAIGIWSAFRALEAGSLLAAAHQRFARPMNFGLLSLAALTVFSAHAATSPDIRKLPVFSIALPSPDGTRWLVGGDQSYSDFQPAFLVDKATGKATYVAPLPSFGSLPRLSADGLRWFAPGKQGYPFGSFFDLSANPPLEVTVPITIEPRDLDFRAAAVDESGELLLRFSPSGEIHVNHLPDGRELAQIKDRELRGYGFLVHRQNSQFDLVKLNESQEDGTPAKSTWRFQLFRFDAVTRVLTAGEAWTYTSVTEIPFFDLAWWLEALPLLEAGVPFAELAQNPKPVALTGGYGALREAAAPGPASGKSYKIIDSRGTRVGGFETGPRAFPVGEIRPGLLLVGNPASADSTGSRHHNSDTLLTWSGYWQTLVVEVPSGRILRSLEGFAPMKHPAAGRQVWLINENGEPFDLASATAEPRPILPIRPLLAKR